MDYNVFVERVICYCLGSIIIIYGLAKIFKTQFFFSLSTADTPIREIPATTLTWYYFGQSYPFALLIAFSQIAGGLLLFFRRTSLLGALILFPIIANIVALNFFYDLWVSTKIVSSLYLLLATFIIVNHYKSLLPILNIHIPKNEANKPAAFLVLKMLVVICFIAFPARKLYSLAEPKERITPLHGSYETTEHKVGPNEVNIMHLENNFWRKVYFDKAYHGAVRTSSNSLEQMEYAIGPKDSLKLRFQNASYDSFKGTYKQEGKYLLIEGVIDKVPVSYKLEKN